MRHDFWVIFYWHTFSYFSRSVLVISVLRLEYYHEPLGLHQKLTVVQYKPDYDNVKSINHLWISASHPDVIVFITPSMGNRPTSNFTDIDAGSLSYIRKLYELANIFKKTNLILLGFFSESVFSVCLRNWTYIQYTAPAVQSAFFH